MEPVHLTGLESSPAERTKSVEQDDSKEDDERALSRRCGAPGLRSLRRRFVDTFRA
jgi:hypothetical protein